MAAKKFSLQVNGIRRVMAIKRQSLFTLGYSKFIRVNISRDS